MGKVSNIPIDKLFNELPEYQKSILKRYGNPKIWGDVILEIEDRYGVQRTEYFSNVFEAIKEAKRSYITCWTKVIYNNKIIWER
jgi:hypothetical protein